MKYILSIIIVLSLISFSTKRQQNISLKKMLQGYWQQKNDHKQIIFISNDVMQSIYKGKLEEKSKLDYKFLKSELSFFNKTKHSFNFWNSESSDFKLEMINSENDTITNFVLYVDNENLELGYNHGTVSFKKLKSIKKYK